VNDQLALLLGRERLGQNGRCGRFHGPLKELSNLGPSWTIFHVVIITTDKVRVSGFALILINSRLHFGFLRLRVIFILLILTLPFFRFIFSSRGRLNGVHLRGLASGRSRRRSILNIRSRLGIGGRGLCRLRLGMDSANHNISHMRSNRGSLDSGSRRTRCVREKIVKSTHLRINEIEVPSATDRLFFCGNSTHGNFMRDFIHEGFREPFCQ
jgi:hypothetical protein